VHLRRDRQALRAIRPLAYPTIAADLPEPYGGYGIGVGTVPAERLHVVTMALDPIFVYGNYIEACLWAGMGVAALLKRNSGWSVALGCALVLFGASDVVEVRTGAWYDPWWLFAWKGICVALILWFGLSVLAVRRRRMAG
jgi:hypothetical protein